MISISFCFFVIRKHKHRRSGKRMSPLAGSPSDEKASGLTTENNSPLFYIVEDETDNLLEPKPGDIANTKV
jgi:hypothetical protein